VKITSPGEVDASNIVRPTADELSAEDCQAYEAFIKDCEEESIRRKAKEIEEKRQWYLSHFSKNRKSDVSKDKEVVILSDEEEQAKSNNNVSAATSSVTLEQVSQLLVSSQEKMLAYVQNMIDKSLGKQPLTDDGSASRSNVDAFQHNYMPPELSATPAPQYGMPTNYYSGQRRPDQYRKNGAVKPVSQTSQTSHGRLIPTDQTGSGALVACPASLEPIASVPHASAGLAE